MRHRVKGRHLARTAEHRRALYRNLISALFEHGRIRTTDAKAREVRPLAEKMITLGKRGDLHARRLVARRLGDGIALQRLFGPIAERFASRPGGYTRMIKAGRRHGDAAPLAYLELLDEAPRAPRTSAERGEAGESKGGKKPARDRAGADSEPRPRGAASGPSGGRSAARGKAKAAPKPRPAKEGSQAKDASRPSTKRGSKKRGGNAD
jgi:large subunit ribosomal protein L17